MDIQDEPLSMKELDIHDGCPYPGWLSMTNINDEQLNLW